MKVKRTMTIDVKRFEVGDVIKFNLTDGEKVEAMAVKEIPDGMLFVTVDCLAEKYPMFKDIDPDMGEDYFTYMNSDLRRVLNGEILNRFPEKIRNRMVAVNAEGDALRIPSEKEILGKNIYGRIENKNIKRWKLMKKHRNRIAFQGREGVHTYYWLMNCLLKYSFGFAITDTSGNSFIEGVNSFHGVRPVFALSNM